jgi:hypothetical protein
MRTLLYLLFLACLIPLLFFGAFAGLLLSYPKKLKRSQDARPLVARRPESPLCQADITTGPVSYRRSEDHESLQGAAEVSGDHGSLNCPSWLSKRLCG